MKNGLQKFGKFLSAMVMPNIGAFIAWGFITALFIADGWIPNAKLASIQPYMLTFLLPMLIAYTGGKQVETVEELWVQSQSWVVSPELVDLMDSQC